MDSETIGALVGGSFVGAAAATVAVLKYRVPRRPVNGSGIDPNKVPAGAIDLATFRRELREAVRDVLLEKKEPRR